MSEDRPPYGTSKPPENSPTSTPENDLARMKKALMVYKNWIWNDGIEIARLSFRVKNLENTLAEMKAALDSLRTPPRN